eukprot:9534062-Prorocentrum_lima.AAC.1
MDLRGQLDPLDGVARLGAKIILRIRTKTRDERASTFPRRPRSRRRTKTTTPPWMARKTQVPESKEDN